jgi:two-component system sensor histidine kinase RpfC
VTADATSETEYRCKNAGMDLRLTKPVDAKLLLATIDQYCNETAVADHGGVDLPVDPLNVVVPLNGGKSDLSSAIDKTQIDYLLSIGDVNFVASMIEGFFEDVTQIEKPLRLAIEQGDVREFRFCAHAIKSSANNMGAKYLAALCGKFEKITEADFAEHRHAYLDKIESEIARAVDALRAQNPNQFSNVGSIRL